ncbi:MAG: amidohydrolase family protein [Treponema sp.]|jgi:adenine deaminase|nr:amidohydrolase family protein [Treponema sp.]
MRSPYPGDRRRLIDAALGRIPVDLRIKNIRFVNMYTGEIYPAAVDILDGLVVRVREPGEGEDIPPKEVYDGGGTCLLPGFIDTHMHVESTMMIPENFSRAVVPWGTTTVCTDPHEIGNVMGIPGVEFMLRNGRRSALRHYVLAPSCVPSVPGVEGAGAAFGAEEIAALLDLPDVVGIAEIMDYIGVINGTDRMRDIVAEGLKRNLFLQGHAPACTGRELAAYRLGGPESDHEAANAREVCERLRMGIHVNLRASSITDHLDKLVEGFRNHPWRDLVSICTDDVHARDLLSRGHINAVVRRVIAAGINPVEAYKFATINAAREYGFDDLGVIAPGCIADIQLLRELDGGRPEAVFIGGKLVAKGGVYLADEYPEVLDMPNTVRVPCVRSSGDLLLRAPEGCGKTVLVRCMVPLARNSTRHTTEWVEFPVRDGSVSLEGVPGDYQFVAVVNRYGAESRTVGILKDFSLQKGAFASTISHDCHNLSVVYKDAEDAYAAVRELERTGGGITVIDGRAPVRTLALPVAGLMSALPCAELSAEIDAMERAVRRYCSPGTSLLATAILSLSVVPGTVITDRGLLDGLSQTFLEIVKPDLR